MVLTNSCTNALFLALKLYEASHGHGVTVTIPSRTYVSVPMQIKLAGHGVAFEDLEWHGCYQLKPLRIWDSARWFTSDMFHLIKERWCKEDGPVFVCCSFHSTKTLGIKRWRRFGVQYDPPVIDEYDIEQGGCILHNDPEADKWFRRARFDGRTEGVEPKDDTFDMIGWHCYMSPATARLGLELMKKLPKHNQPIPNDDYPDLSKAPIF